MSSGWQRRHAGRGKPVSSPSSERPRHDVVGHSARAASIHRGHIEAAEMAARELSGPPSWARSLSPNFSQSATRPANEQAARLTNIGGAAGNRARFRGVPPPAPHGVEGCPRSDNVRQCLSPVCSPYRIGANSSSCRTRSWRSISRSMSCEHHHAQLRKKASLYARQPPAQAVLGTHLLQTRKSNVVFESVPCQIRGRLRSCCVGRTCPRPLAPEDDAFEALSVEQL